MKNFFTIFLSFTISALCIAQSKSNKDCKVLLDVDPIVETVEKKHYIFTGSDTTGLNVKFTKITVVEPKMEMVKRRNKNCTSLNQEDCFTSTLEEIPAVSMNFYTLPSPDFTNEYEIRKENVKVVKRAAGKEEVSIVCPKNRSKSLIKKVQTSLIALGYPLTVSGNLDQQTLLSIIDFQKVKSLAYGDLTLETLAALGVK